MGDWIRALAASFAKRLVQEAEMQEQRLSPSFNIYDVQGHFVRQMQPLIVVMEDEIIHTDEHPFCGDMTCGCHTDRMLVREHLMEPERAGLLTWFEARALWRGVTL